jgi:hypothetical protein
MNWMSRSACIVVLAVFTTFTSFPVTLSSHFFTCIVGADDMFDKSISAFFFQTPTPVRRVMMMPQKDETIRQ